MTNINFKQALERVFLKDLRQWKHEKLSDNLVIKRKNKLKIA
jgi:hypothetical protein